MKPGKQKTMLAALIAFCLALSACGSDGDDAIAAATESEATEDTTEDAADTTEESANDDSSDDDAASDTSDGDETGNDSSAECTPAHEVETVEEGFLTVAAYAYPPFSDFDGDDLAGAEGEIITRIAELECLEVKVVKGDASAMIASITSGRADTTIGSWYRTAEREEVVNLSAPVIADRLTLISVEGVGTIADLDGHKVGSISGFLWNDDLAGVIGDDLKLYDTGQAMYADLKAGRISVIVDTFPSAQAVLETTPIDGIQFVVPPPDEAVVSTQKPGQSNFPTNKDNAGLQAAIDENIESLRSSGELEQIVVANGFQADAADPGEPNKL